MSMEDVCFSYDGRAHALEHLSLEIGTGEFVALVGPNGSGKSTIAKLIDRLLMPTSGRIEVFGIGTADAGSEKKIRPRIGIIMQNPDDQLVSARVIDEIAFGPENLGLPPEEIEAHVEEAMTTLNIEDLRSRNVHELSGGQKQKVAIAGALAMNAELLILDEATSMLDSDARKALMNTLEELHRKGQTILMITHNPDEAKHADRIISLDKSEIGAFEASEITFDELSQRTCAIYERYGFSEPAYTHSAVRASNVADPIVAFDQVGFSYSETADRRNGFPRHPPVFENLSFEVHPGEMLAITGPNGCGKSTVLKNMNGLLHPTSGTVKVDGQSLDEKRAALDARFTVGLVFQYPEKQLFATSVYDDIAFGPKNMGLDESEIETRVREAMESTGLPFDNIAHKSPFALSGGQMRKVAIAGVLAMRPRLIALDEPCVSLDLPSKLDLMRLLIDLNERGTTVVLVTHDEDDIELLGCRELKLAEDAQREHPLYSNV